MTIHLSDPYEVIALCPHLIGYRPSDSVVLVALASRAKSGGPMIRLDAETIPERLIDVTIDFIADFEVTSLAMIWYGGSLAQMLADQDSLAILDTAGLAAQQFIDSFADGFVTVAITDYEHWISGAGARSSATQTFSQLLEDDVIRDFAALNQAPAIVEFVFQGSAPLASEPVIDNRVAWSQRRDAVAAAKNAKADATELWQGVLDQFYGGAAVGQILSDQVLLGELNAGLANVLLRDRLIMLALSAKQKPLDQIGVTEISRKLLEGGDQLDLEPWIELFEYLARYSDDTDPVAYTVAAYLSWWYEDRARAVANARRAANSDFTYPLLRLVLQALFIDLPTPAVGKKPME